MDTDGHVVLGEGVTHSSVRFPSWLKDASIDGGSMLPQ